MADIKPDSRVLEDGSQALLDAADTVAGGAGDEQIEFADLNDLKPGDSAAAKPAAGAKPNVDAGKPAADDEGLPPEFKGKSKADIVRMYQDAHKVIGRQGSELGELRQKADFAIKASLEALRGRKEPGQQAQQQAQQQAAQAAMPPDESEFFARPYEAVSKAIEAKLAESPIIKEIRATLGRAEADQATSRAVSATERFNRAHPDAAEILRDEEFRTWVAASPIRRTLLQRAHTAYDFDAGDEVFSTWKALKGSKQPASRAGEQPAGDGQPSAADVSAAAAILAKQRQAKSEAAARAASVPTGGASGAAKSGAGAGGKKIFRRADVIHLMETDPERYERLADEIALAYAENRVR